MSEEMKNQLLYEIVISRVKIGIDPVDAVREAKAAIKELFKPE